MPKCFAASFTLITPNRICVPLLLKPASRTVIFDLLIFCFLSIKTFIVKLLFYFRINNIYIDGLESISTCSYEQPSKSLTLFTNPLNLSQSEDYNISEILNCSYNDGYSYGSFVIAVDRLIQKMEMFKSKYEIDYIELRDENSFLWVNRFNNSFYESELPELWLKNPEESLEIQNEFKDNAICNNASVYKEFSL